MIFLINPVCEFLFGAGLFTILAWTIAIVLAIIGLIKILWFD